MPVTGFEIAIGQAAASGVARLTNPLEGKWRLAHDAKKAVDITPLVPESYDVTLTPDESSRLIDYLHSSDLTVIAMQLATREFQAVKGINKSVNPFDVTTQLREGLNKYTSISGSALRALVSIIENRLNHAVLSIVVPLIGTPSLSPKILSKIISGAADQAAASIRNSELLQHVKDLAGIHCFEDKMREQIRALKGQMHLANAGTIRSVAYSSLYVEPTVKFGESQDSSTMIEVEAQVVLSHIPRVVLLGDPGGGKSTLASKIVHDLAFGNATDRIPFLLVLRDYISKLQSDRTTILRNIEDLCRSPYQVEPPPNALEYLLLNGRAVVVFDGLDEVTDVSLRSQVVQAIEGFAHRYPSTSIIITSRRIGYNEAPLSPTLFSVAELNSFSDSQVRLYATNWFALDPELSPEMVSKVVETFMLESELTSDLRANPLMLSLICGLYKAEGYIPQNLPDVYEKCALLLFERWDKQRGISTELPFDSHLRSAIQSLAWRLYTDPISQLGLPKAKLLDYLAEYLHRERFSIRDDAVNAASSFIEFCTGRAWIITNVDTGSHGELYGFTHRTFLEYFAATQVVRMCPNAERLFVELHEHIEFAEWDMFAQLALQTLNRYVENGANDFLEKLIDVSENTSVKARANLLSFAARSLAFVVPNPRILERVVSSVLSFWLSAPDEHSQTRNRSRIPLGELYIYDQLLIELSGCSREIIPDVVRLMINVLTREFVSGEVTENLLLMCESPGMYLLSGNPELLSLIEWDDLRQLYVNYCKSNPFIWADAQAVKAGRLPLATALQRHGAEVLYYFAATGPSANALSLRASLFFSVLKRTADSSDGLDDSLAREIANVIPALSRPWFTDVAFLRNCALHYTQDSSQLTLNVSAFLMLSLPLLEVDADWGGDAFRFLQDPRVGAWGDVLAICREGRRRTVAQTVVSNRLKDVALEKQARKFIIDWCRGKFALTSIANQ